MKSAFRIIFGVIIFVSGIFEGADMITDGKLTKFFKSGEEENTKEEN